MPTIRAANVAAAVDAKKAVITSLELGRAGVKMVEKGPAGFLEVLDRSTGKLYNPLKSAFRLTKQGRSAKGASFEQRYEDAPFKITQSFAPTEAGVRWEAVLRLLPGEKRNHTLRVTFVLPCPPSWKFWAPQDVAVHTNDGVTPRRVLYGHTSFRPYGTMIPLVATWNGQAGLVAFSPPDIQKPAMSFDLNTLQTPNWVRGINHALEDVPQLRVVYHHVGLRPGKELRLAVTLAACKPDWRTALGHYVEAYPELFEVVPKTHTCGGMYGITNPTNVAKSQALDRLAKAGVTFAEIHGHFPEYSVFMLPEALKNPKLTWNCRPHPTDYPLSLEGNRRCIEQFLAAGIAPFMYFYNCHALPDTIQKRWPGSTMRDENGQPLLKWYTEPSVWGAPESPYGKHVLEQMELLLKAYPRTFGYFIDNYAIEMYDFGHDDGVTMVHDRPCYDLNRNHQQLGPPCFEMAHKAGKVVMVNKISTIESLRGADMCLAETQDETSIKKHALACVFRPLFPLAMALKDEPHAAERGMQQLLVNGCVPDDHIYFQDPKAMTAYRPLTDCMIGKRWVLDYQPLDVPAGLEGQIFRIHKAAPSGGSVVVALVDQRRSWQGKPATKNAQVTIRLPENAKLRKATWLSVEKSRAKPLACRIKRNKDKSITVSLPPVGAAGILRLS